MYYCILYYLLLCINVSYIILLLDSFIIVSHSDILFLYRNNNICN